MRRRGARIVGGLKIVGTRTVAGSEPSQLGGDYEGAKRKEVGPLVVSPYPRCPTPFVFPPIWPTHVGSLGLEEGIRREGNARREGGAARVIGETS